MVLYAYILEQKAIHEGPNKQEITELVMDEEYTGLFKLETMFVMDVVLNNNTNSLFSLKNCWVSWKML